MSESPESLEVAHQWIEKAEHDLKNAEHTLTLEQDCPFDTICFHAQQCAEKYLKALLVSQSLDFPRTHDMRLLVQLVMSRLSLVLNIAEVLKLNRYERDRDPRGVGRRTDACHSPTPGGSPANGSNSLAGAGTIFKRVFL